MRKIIVILLAYALFGCTQEIKSNTKQDPSTFLANESAVTSIHENTSVKHKFTLEENFFRAAGIIGSNAMPKQDYEMLLEMANAKNEEPEIILFMFISSADEYTEREIANFLKDVPSRFIENEECKDEFDYFEVFQTFTDKEGKVVGALARGKKNKEYNPGIRVFYFPVNFRNKTGELLYDGLKIEPKKDDCVEYYSTYTYINMDKIQKTVPIVAFSKWQEIPNPKYITWLENFANNFLTNHPEWQKQDRKDK